MKIGVLADTHIPKAAPDLPAAIYNDFKAVDLILHAGDITEVTVIRALEKLAPVKAVYGNMDMMDIRALYPKKNIITVDNVRIGLIHGFGPPNSVFKMVRTEFDSAIDVIVFGHTHIPYNEKKGGTLLLNPGSPTDKVFAPYNSYGILEITNGAVIGRIVKI
ncbi:MAG: metallophosphoesterase family protein [Candidatus Omnitrophica bacterium]|nr:metallophosphoesterase family protein [Candidatus Omnitrophota bacterium]